ncbi:MAG: MarR family transcriptional regulator [Oscillospiraceae bacterium]|nr:MarR family transcriptional regulator [Oscillospiraceae bacterium]
MQERVEDIRQEIMASLDEKADTLFRFVMLYHDFAMEKKDYGTGEFVSMVEAHILLRIANRPGITVSELAEEANRTKSAISQTVKKLEGMGYTYRKYSETDGRVVQLYPTDRGLELNRAHGAYDSIEVTETFEELLKHCSDRDLDSFFRVVNAYLTIFAEEDDSI